MKKCFRVFDQVDLGIWSRFAEFSRRIDGTSLIFIGVIIFPKINVNNKEINIAKADLNERNWNKVAPGN